LGVDGNDIIDGGDGNDVIEGGWGSDMLYGGAGNDTFLVNGFEQAWNWDTFDGGTGVDTILGGASDDTIRVHSLSAANSIERIDGGAGVNVLSGTDGSDLIDLSGIEILNIARIAGGDGVDTIIGTAGNDVIDGGSGDDTLYGGGGTDVLQGGNGNDQITILTGNGLLKGDAGYDNLTGTGGHDLFIGSNDNDTITTGTGYDMIAFNRGDGADIVVASTGADNTLSLGGGIRNQDLAFRKSSKNLILDTGSGESITLQNWYSSIVNRSVLTLQMIEAAASDFAPGGADPLRDNKVEQFNFAGLVTAFDQAIAASPTLTSWALSNALLTFYLGGSDTQAIGGDLAYQYGKTGSLSNIGFTAAQSMLANTQFGQVNQAINQVGLSDGTVRLSA
jgi:Ca2+-binding RTX toxin-like protein